MAKQEWFRPQEQEIKGKKVAYINARLIDPASGLDAEGGLLTQGEKIKDFGEGLFKDGVPSGVDEVIDLKGNVLCPGLLDIQVHFREPGQEHKETVETGSKSAVAGGVTQVVCQPNTNPVLDSLIALEYLQKRADETAYCHIKTYAAITENMKGERLSDMAQLAEHPIVVGFTDDGLPVMDSLIMRHAFDYAAQVNMPLAQHAEDIRLTNGGAINEGKVSYKLGVKGISNATESIIVARDCELLKITDGRYHLLHVSTKESLDVLRRAKEQGLNATAEACPHHFWLTDEAVLKHGSNAKMNPPLRSEEDRKAIIEGLKDGTIDAITTDHAPHDKASKDQPLEKAAFGIVGLETMLPLSLELQKEGMELIDIIGKMTHKAADIINVPSGRLKKGAVADLTVIDLKKKWTVKAKQFASKSKNTPFDGRKLIGRAVRTVVGGKTVYTYN